MYETINIQGKSFEELLALFLVDISEDDDYYDILAYHLAMQYKNELTGMLRYFSNKRLRAAICGIGLACSQGSIIGDDVLEKYLFHENPLVVSAAIDALHRNGARNWKTIEPMLNHGSHFVRGATLRYCRKAFGSEAAPQLLASLNDPHPIVRENALDELAGIADHSMLNSIEVLLNDDTDSVRQAAQELLDAIQQGI